MEICKGKRGESSGARVLIGILVDSDTRRYEDNLWKTVTKSNILGTKNEKLMARESFRYKRGWGDGSVC